MKDKAIHVTKGSEVRAKRYVSNAVAFFLLPIEWGPMLLGEDIQGRIHS